MTTGRKLLVLGSGGREHALCWKLAQSDLVDAIICAPGNGGTATCAKTQNAPLSPMDFEAVTAFVQAEQIDTVIVGPENPLAAGLVDYLEARHIRVFGPQQAAAKLEASKAFSKLFMQEYGLPTARFEVANSKQAALEICRDNDWARVIKADGLALGKGVFVCDSLAECETAIATIFDDNAFGDAGLQVVIEERLVGPEASLFLFCDGQTVTPCRLAQDYKRRFEENKGPNTGGMGPFSPVGWAMPYEHVINERVIKPLEAALQAAPFTYKGLLFVGLMFSNSAPSQLALQAGSAHATGAFPYILEFNCRFGDPETQSILPLLETDLLMVIDACIDGTLDALTLSWSDQHAVCVVATAENYPASGSKEQPIQLPQHVSNGVIFHAGTVMGNNSQILTNGGRVLNFVGLGSTNEAAKTAAYAIAKQSTFSDMAYRSDIGVCYDTIAMPLAEGLAV